MKVVLAALPILAGATCAACAARPRATPAVAPAAERAPLPPASSVAAPRRNQHVPHDVAANGRWRLLGDRTIDGVACKGGDELGLFDDGALSFCTVRSKTRKDGVVIARDAYTLFYEDGRLWQTTTAEPRSFDVAALADRRVPCAAGALSLARDGALAWCVLAARVEPRPDVACRLGEGIAFHEKPPSSFAGCTLDAPFRAAADVVFPAGTSVSFDPAGAPVSATFAAPTSVRGLVVEGAARFGPSLALVEARLGAPATLGGAALPEHARVTLRADRTPVSASYVDGYGTMPHGELVTRTRYVTFDAAGKVTRSWVDEDVAPGAPPMLPGR